MMYGQIAVDILLYQQIYRQTDIHPNNAYFIKLYRSPVYLYAGFW